MCFENNFEYITKPTTIKEEKCMNFIGWRCIWNIGKKACNSGSVLYNILQIELMALRDLKRN